MKVKLVTSDYVECDLIDEKVIADKYDKSGNKKMNTFNVSRDNTDVSKPCCLPLSNGGFIVFWLQGKDNEKTIYSRRYTAQGLAGKILNFPIENLAKNEIIDVELKDDFFINIKWTTQNNDVYSKLFNQEGIEQGKETFLHKKEIIEPVSVVEENNSSNENITYKVVSKTETHITKVDIKRPNIIKVEQILPQQSQSVPPSPRTNAPFNTFPQLKQPRKLPPLKPVNQSMIGLTGRRVVMNNRFKMFK